MEQIFALTIEKDEDFLRQVSTPISFKKDDINSMINVIDNYCINNDLILALAAVQIGIPKRIIYLKNTNLEIINKKNNHKETVDDLKHNERKMLINPVVISREGLTDYWEACASCLDYTGHVKRPYKIVIKYNDVNGKLHRKTFKGFESTVLSHELDHLDGILHMDVADEVLVMNIDERKEFRKTHDYNIISKEGDYYTLKNNIY